MISPYHILLFCLYYLMSLLHLLLCPISPYLFLILFLIVIRLSGLSSVWFNKNTIFLCLILWKPFQSMTPITLNALIDHGSHIVLISNDLVIELSLKRRKLVEPMPVELAMPDQN